MAAASEQQLAQAVHGSHRSAGAGRHRRRQPSDQRPALAPAAPRDRSWPPRCPTRPRRWSNGWATNPSTSVRRPPPEPWPWPASSRPRPMTPRPSSPLAISCTASLASDRPKRGEHRAHFAYQTPSTTAATSLVLEKGRRGRTEEESLVAAMLLNLVAEACGVEARGDVPLAPGEQVETRCVVASREQQELLAGSQAARSARRRGRAATRGPVGRVQPAARRPPADGGDRRPDARHRRGL